MTDAFVRKSVNLNSLPTIVAISIVCFLLPFVWRLVDTELIKMAAWKLLPVYAAVLVVSLWCRCRQMLVNGIVGASCAPLFLPPGFMDHELAFARITATQWQIVGAFVASLACLNTWAWVNRKEGARLQFSNRTILLLVLNISIALALVSALSLQ